ncbi:hypothetical protein [Peribacillus frigoritolerans]|uniref:hypothetical protein n=1 Tax=Peribacillus frigoritolerans TaxID=450367 RepID=UPI003DA040B1
MRSFLRKEFWDDRNKPILFIQWVLIIFAIIVYFQTYDSIDYIYSGILRLIAGIIILCYWVLLLTGPLILKQRKILPKGFGGVFGMAKNSIS